MDIVCVYMCVYVCIACFDVLFYGLHSEFGKLSSRITKPVWKVQV